MRDTLEKKHPNLPIWSKRIVVLISNKLIYYDLGNDDQAKGVLDFNLLSCDLKVKKKDPRIFMVVVFKSTRKFYFKSETLEIAKKWIKAINREIINSKGYHTNLTRVSLQPKFWKLDRISQDELMETAETADIVLFRTYGFMSKIQRVITWSRIDHIGLVIRNDMGELYLLESLGKRGVDFYRWTNFTRCRWNADYEQMIYRKLYCSRTAEILNDLYKFAKVILQT